MAVELQSESTESESPSPAGRRGGNSATTTPARPSESQSTWRQYGKVFWIIAALTGISAVGYFLYPRQETGEKGDWLTHTVKLSDLKVTVSEEGNLESANNLEFKCRVKGGSTIVWTVEDGAIVEPGDVLMRFDSSAIEDEISAQEILYQTALSTYVQAESDLAVAKINLTEYEKGTFRSEQKLAQANLALAEADLVTAKNAFDHSRRMFRKGYVSKLEVDANALAVEQAQLQLEVRQTELEVLEQYTKEKKLEEFRSALAAAEAKLASDKSALELEEARLARKRDQLEACEIKTDAGGMVLYSTGRDWEEAPAIDIGSTVYEQQTLLKLPDLQQMQVKIGIHESKIDEVKTGMKARVETQGQILDGKVKSIATVTAPAGWWNGNQVAYDTIISIDAQEGMKPGMSADVEIFLAEYNDVLTIPVSAVVELNEKFFCWVEEGEAASRRELSLGASNEQFIVVETGITEGDRVILNPSAFIEEARDESMKPKQGDESKSKEELGIGA